MQQASKQSRPGAPRPALTSLSRTRRRAPNRKLLSWEAWVYDSRSGKKIRKSFPTHAAAKAWRREAPPQ